MSEENKYLSESYYFDFESFEIQNLIQLFNITSEDQRSLSVAVYMFAPQEVFIRHRCNLQEGACHLKQEGVELKFSMSPTPVISSKDVSYRLEVTL